MTKDIQYRKFIELTSIHDSKVRYYNIDKIDVITVLSKDEYQSTILIAFDWDDVVGAIPDEARTFKVYNPDLHSIIIGK